MKVGQRPGSSCYLSIPLGSFCLLLLIVPIAVHVERQPFPAAVRPTESPAAIQSRLCLLSMPLCRLADGQLIVSSPQSRATIVTLLG